MGVMQTLELFVHVVYSLPSSSLLTPLPSLSSLPSLSLPSLSPVSLSRLSLSFSPFVSLLSFYNRRENVSGGESMLYVGTFSKLSPNVSSERFCDWRDGIMGM